MILKPVLYCAVPILLDLGLNLQPAPMCADTLVDAAGADAETDRIDKIGQQHLHKRIGHASGKKIDVDERTTAFPIESPGACR